MGVSGWMWVASDSSLCTTLRALQITLITLIECFFWYQLTQVVPDKIHRAVKWLCVCTQPNLTNFLCMLPVAVARSSFCSVAVRDVLLVSCLTSCFHKIGCIGHVVHILERREQNIYIDSNQILCNYKDWQLYVVDWTWGRSLLSGLFVDRARHSTCAGWVRVHVSS